MLRFNEQNKYRKALTWVLILALLAAAQSAILALLSWQEPQPNYYATTTNGVVVDLHPLSEPVLTSTYITEWASLATRKVFNLSFINYDNEIQQTSQYFTPDAEMKFKAALKSAGLLDTVAKEKVNMSAVVSNAPVILNRGIYQGRFTWTVQLPVLITFSSASETQNKHVIVTMNVQRIPTLNTAQGLMISDFFATTAN